MLIERLRKYAAMTKQARSVRRRLAPMDPYAEQPQRPCECGANHWLIGRYSAECGECTMPMPLARNHFAGDRFTTIFRKEPTLRIIAGGGVTRSRGGFVLPTFND